MRWTTKKLHLFIKDEAFAMVLSQIVQPFPKINMD